MGLLKTATTLLAIFLAIWWAIAEKKYNDLVDKGTLPTGKDPKLSFYSRSEDILDVIACPEVENWHNGAERVLLVHGTGMT
jgi:hypothetical protein